MASVHPYPSHLSLFPPFTPVLISFSGLLSIFSSLWVARWPEPCSGDCLCSSMWGSHFRSPMTIPGSAAPPWLMLYKTFFTVVTFRVKQAGSELSICSVHLPVPPSSLTAISPSLAYLFVFVGFSPLNSCFPSVFSSIFHLPVFLLYISPYVSALSP